MRKHTVRLLAVVLSAALASALLTACAKDEFKLKNGSAIPGEVTAELGALYMIPEAEGGDSVRVTVKDAKGAEVRVNNNKFRVTDMGGYTVTYTLGEKTATTRVTVRDTKPPVIGLGVPEGMAVIRGTEFNIPACTVSDSSGEALTATVTVKDKNDAEVTVTDNRFTASEIGEYRIVYSATDSSGNTGSKLLTVSCENADLLNGFETEDSVGYMAFNGTKEAVSEFASNGKGVKITVDDETNAPYRRICLPLKKNGEYLSYQDLQKYEKVQLYVYMSEDNELGLANQTYAVKKGVNVIVFTQAQIQAAYAFSEAQYEENANGFYLNYRYPTNGSYLILDDFIGIYARDYEPEKPADYTMEIAGVDGMTALLGEAFRVPGCTVRDLEGNELTYRVTVKDASGNDVTLTENRFTPDAIGEYTVRYDITQEGFDGSKELTVVCKKAEVLNDFSAVEDIVGIGGFSANKEVTGENTIGESGVKLTPTGVGSWVQVYVALKDDGDPTGFISWEDLQKFRKIQIYLYSKVAGQISLANGDPRVKISKGWNLVEFSLTAIKASHSLSDAQYGQKKGFYLTFPTITQEDVFIFDSIVGVYADDYEEPTGPEYEPSMKVQGVNGMTALYGEDFAVPVCKVTDDKGQAVDCTVTVEDKDGNAVTVTDGKFTANVLGTYTITYAAEGFEPQNLEIFCKKGKVLNAFEAAGDMTYVGAWNGYVTELERENTLTGGGLRLTADTGACSWGQFYIPLKNEAGYLTWADLQKFEKIQIYLYASAGGGDLVHPSKSPWIPLKQGWNIVEISIAELVAGYEIAPYAENANGQQLMITAIPLEQYVIFDSIVGVYADDYEEPTVPEYEPSMKVQGVNGMTALYGEDFAVPLCKVTDDKGQAVDCTVTVVDKDGNAVTVTDGKFTANVLGIYTITYAAEGFEPQSLEIFCKKGKVLNAFETAGDMTYVGAWNGYVTELERENTLTGGGLRLTADTGACSWGQFFLPLKDEAGYLTWADLQMFEKIQIYLYASAGGGDLVHPSKSPWIPLKQGWNIVEISIAELVAGYETAPYAENANGQQLMITAIPLDQYVIFDSIVGVYADDYEEGK